MPSGESAVLKERPKVKKRIKWKSGLLRALLYVVIILFGVTFAFPFFLTLMNSLKPLTASVGLSQIIPSEFHWENYYYAVTLIPFFKYLLNSLIIVAIVVPMCTIINMSSATLRPAAGAGQGRDVRHRAVHHDDPRHCHHDPPVHPV